MGTRPLVEHPLSVALAHSDSFAAGINEKRVALAYRQERKRYEELLEGIATDSISYVLERHKKERIADE